jgi:two-component system, LytTR family, sensor kinase
MEAKKSYWLYQILGWSFYSFSDLLNYFTVFSFNFDEFDNLIGNGIVNVAAGISLTHIFRVIFKRYEWGKLPVTQLVLRSAAVVGIVTFILAAINIPMDRDIINTEKMNWALRDISYLINLSKPVLIWVLLYVFYSVANLRKNDAVERVQLESSIKETEAKILMAQMNPHFIFNALNSIRALITEEPSKAISGITQLSNLLRSSLVSNRKKTVSLREEIKTIGDYLSLEKIRYEDRLQMKIAIDKNTESIQVPPMMLQTLVENGIKHGVQKALRWGFIEISSHIEGEHLVIHIRNTGKLERTTSKSDAGGFGLENTKRRLQLLYGNKSSFRIFQENHLTVNAEIKIPLET